ncbi:MAG: signal peptidase I [Aristaeellaceae bacterium]
MMENNTPAAAEENQEATQPTVRPNRKNKPKKPLWREIVEWIVTLAVAVAIALVIRTFLFEPVRVDGHSMDDTLANGEVMFVTKPEYLFGTPERFDVVICHYPGRGNTNFVKRVVGLPGDVVQITGGYLYINGEKYEEDYLTHRPNYEMEPYQVPEGQYFVLGDNRSNSNDSHLIGPIDESMIMGKVHQVIFPLSAWRSIE